MWLRWDQPQHAVKVLLKTSALWPLKLLLSQLSDNEADLFPTDVHEAGDL